LTGAAVAPPRVNVASAAPFDQVRFCEFRYFLENQLLGDADAFTMCRGLELRTPFVDHRLVDATIQAGRWQQAKGLSYKATLFRYLSDLTVPSAVDRRKQGFVLPFDVWMREALTSPRPRRLADLKATLDQPRYHSFVSRYLDGQLPWSRLWALYVLERMRGQHFSSHTAAASAAAS
jgi:asparagine synthase (glutamine-hydrolysing)